MLGDAGSLGAALALLVLVHCYRGLLTRCLLLPTAQAQTLEEICFSAGVKSTEEEAKALEVEVAKQEEKRKEVGCVAFVVERS